MNIVVIVKRIDSSESASHNKVLDICDKTAIDQAVQIREKCGAASNHVSAVCIAPVDASEVIRECYCLGVDTGYLLADPVFESVDLNGIVTILFNSISKIGNIDIIVMSSPANDEVMVALGSKLAGLFGIRHLKGIEAIEGFGNKIFTRAKSSEKELLEIPALVNLVCNQEQKVHNAMRIMKAFKKEIKVWNSRDIEFDPRKPTPVSPKRKIGR